MIHRILPIVEGESEVEGVPILLRRLVAHLHRPEVLVERPFRVKRLKVVKPGEIERSVIQGVRGRTGITAILVILDADDDDPEPLESSLLERCRTVTQLPVAVVLARRELESWFLGAKDSLRGVCGIRSNANAPDGPELIRGAKERLTRNMEGGRRYLEVDDQPAMAAKMDLDRAAQRCVSFRRLVAELEKLLAAAASPEQR
jgi:hypothetical protein